MKKILVGFLLCSLLIGVIPLSATSISDKKNEIDQTKEELASVQNELKTTEAEKAKEQKELKALDQKIIKIEEEVIKVEEALEQKHEEIEKVKQALKEATEKRDHQYESTKQRMVQMYKNSRTGYMEIFLSSNNLSELLTRSKYIRTISTYDNKLIEEYERQQQIIIENEEKLEAEEIKLQKLFDEQLAAKNQLETMRKEKNKRIGILENQTKELHDLAVSFEEEYKQLERELKKLQEQQKSQLKYNGGKFAWPVPGHYRISSGYYHRVNPVTGRDEWHKGIDIPAPYGKAVVAAADGIVTTAGPVGSFGNTVMIDHGSGITTIYAHNSSVTVSPGQKVQKGQQVAKIGSTGRSTGNHCHFEVRINNQHTSPWNYLSK